VAYYFEPSEKSAFGPNPTLVIPSAARDLFVSDWIKERFED
jgi:hypothetical protein